MSRRAALLFAAALTACAADETDVYLSVYSALSFDSESTLRGVCIEVQSRGLAPQRVVAPVSPGIPPRKILEFRIVPRDEDLSQPITVTVVARTRTSCSQGLELARRSRVVRFIPNERVSEAFVLGGAADPTPDGGVADAPVTPLPDVPPAGGCPAGLSLCGGACTNVRFDPRNCGGCGMVCPDTTYCVNGACTCPAGQSLCNGRRCTDPRSDPDWCGPSGCGRPCQAVPDGMRGCQAGRCVYTCNVNFTPTVGGCTHCGLVNEPPCDPPSPCAPGLAFCAGLCRNFNIDRNHCGACNAQCPPSLNCISAACR